MCEPISRKMVVCRKGKCEDCSQKSNVLPIEMRDLLSRKRGGSPGEVVGLLMKTWCVLEVCSSYLLKCVATLCMKGRYCPPRCGIPTSTCAAVSHGREKLWK